jgi:hypothetical protein
MRSRNWVWLKSMFGGELRGMTKNLAELRNEAAFLGGRLR